MNGHKIMDDNQIQNFTENLSSSLWQYQTDEMTKDELLEAIEEDWNSLFVEVDEPITIEIREVD